MFCFVFSLSPIAMGFLGFPKWFSCKESTCQCRRHEFDPWVRKIPWSRKWLLTPVFLPKEFHGQRSLVGYSPWSHRESDMTEGLTLSHFHFLLPTNYSAMFHTQEFPFLTHEVLTWHTLSCHHKSSFRTNLGSHNSLSLSFCVPMVLV